MFSLVIPIFNEEKLIDDLLKRTIPSIESFAVDYEVIFVDDGSTDKSIEKILAWREGNEKIKLLSLSKNFGHQAAYTAGLENASGDIVAMMDGDLQDPPELLSAMYRKLTEEDYDIISGKRTGRKGSRGRIIYSVLFHSIFTNIGELRDMDNYGNYSMMNRIALDALLSMKEKVRYLPGLRSFIGFRHGDVEFVRDDRFRGQVQDEPSEAFCPCCRCYFLIFQVPDTSMPLAWKPGNNRLHGSRYLCFDFQNYRQRSSRMVIDNVEHLFPGIYTACLPGDTWGIYFQKL